VNFKVNQDMGRGVVEGEVKMDACMSNLRVIIA
jgi:hypothetical protein